MANKSKIEVQRPAGGLREKVRVGLSALAAAFMFAPLSGSVSVTGESGYQPPLEAPKPPALARPFESQSIDQLIPTANPKQLPELPAPMVDTCQEGVPVEFHSPDMGIYHAPIELVGIDNKGTPNDPSDDSVAAPHGRGQDGGYNTVGWYKFGAKPGAKEGVPVFSAHSTRVEKSLLPREWFTQRIMGAIATSEPIYITVTVDNGGKCNYVVSLEGVHIVKGKQSNYEDVFSPIVNGERSGEIVFNTCAGPPNPFTGSSEDAILLNGKQSVAK